MVGFFLIERDGGGEAMAKSSSRLASVEFMFSLSSICMESESWLFTIYKLTQGQRGGLLLETGTSWTF
jgi:hypothetical protein